MATIGLQSSGWAALGQNGPPEAAWSQGEQAHRERGHWAPAEAIDSRPTPSKTTFRILRPARLTDRTVGRLVNGAKSLIRGRKEHDVRFEGSADRQLLGLLW